MGKFASQQQLASRLITSKGVMTTITQNGEPSATFNPIGQVPVAGKRVGKPPSAKFPVVGLPPGQSAQYRVGSLAGRNIEQFYIATLGAAFIPTKGDSVTWKGTSYKLVWTEEYDPAADGVIMVMGYGEA